MSARDTSDATSNTNRTIEAIFIALYDSNYSEFPDSWCELFDNLEYVMLSICVGLSASMHDKMVSRPSAPHILICNTCGLDVD